MPKSDQKLPEVTRSDRGNVGDVGEGRYDGDKDGGDDGGDRGEKGKEGEGKNLAGERTGPLKVVQEVLADPKQHYHIHKNLPPCH